MIFRYYRGFLYKGEAMPSITYWMLAVCCFLYYLAARYGLPETKGRQLEDIQAEYQTLKLQSDAI